MRVYQQRLRYFIDFLVQKGVSDTEQMNADHLRAFIIELRQRDAHILTNHHKRGQLICARTVFHYTRIIKTFGTWLTDQDILMRNPFGKVKLPRVEKKLMPSLPAEDITSVYNAIRTYAGDRMNRDLALYCFMLESGARRSEVVKLCLDDLYLDNYTAKVHGKGSKERLVCFTDKTANLLK
jgi:integrase/recombinase XerD